MPARDRVQIQTDGSFKVLGAAAERRLRDRAGVYRLAVDAPGLLVFREDKDGGAGSRVAMAGELLTRTSVLEIVNVIANASWRGELFIHEDRYRRVLSIDQGALKYAWSDHPDDRLGEILYRHGLLSREQLDGLIAEVGPTRRIGELLLDKGFIGRESLFQQLQKQIEQIFFSALLAKGGHYLFIVPDEDEGEPPAHTVYLPIQSLLMEGVQRIDEMALFREKIPSDELAVQPQPKATTMTLDDTAQQLLALADGNRSIEELSRESGLGQFITIKSIYGLLQQGAVILKPKKDLDEAAVKALVSSFNEVLRDIFMAVATYGGIDQTRATLSAWITGSGYATLFGEDVDEDGSIPHRQVIRALREVNADNPMAGLHQALHELAAFALFAATTSLPRDQELMLSRDVNSRLKRIRIP